eukprot:TRINITY_DN17399_c0_g3_i1.p1 TRINITY_DN17399_c0_g3~~TRINITY_DN17399_c0_g3_i1.p1  ORF type:complete len:160 (+),score=41.77 TRINITY_DN17399_c0_g3_i1:172-651(+)
MDLTMSSLLWLSLALASGSVNQMVVYHVHPPAAPDVPRDMDTGDTPSDLYFDERGVAIPLECRLDPSSFNCANPEQSGDLVVSKVVLEYDTVAVGEYARCNDVNGTYQCLCGDYRTPTKCNATIGKSCLLYTSDAADEEDSVDLGGRRIIKKKKKREVR